MRVIVAAICLILTCNCLVAHPRGGGGSPPTATEIPDSLFEQAIACIKRFDYEDRKSTRLNSSHIL